jgi:hypothetical protein
MRVLGLALIFVSQTASAKVLEIYAQAQGGVAAGRGLSGDQKDNAFFEDTSGAAYGALVGAEILFIDAWIEHNQYNDGELVGTWTQFMAGFDMDIAMDDPPPKQPSRVFFELGLGVGFGMGTGQQVMPPLDNGEISDKGFVAQARLGIDYRFASVVSIGVSVPLTWGYLLKNDVANDQSNHYQAIHGAALAHFRFRIDAM